MPLEFENRMSLGVVKDGLLTAGCDHTLTLSYREKKMCYHVKETNKDAFWTASFAWRLISSRVSRTDTLCLPFLIFFC